MSSMRSSSQSRASLRVAVTSDHSLVAESVAAALANRGFDPVAVQWPREGPRPEARARRLRSPRRSVGPPPDVGLVMTDLTRVEQVQGAASLVTALDVPWLVMAGVSRGAAWGGLYERGVQLVVESDTGLDEVHQLLIDLAAGRRPAGLRRKRRELIQAWRSFAEERGELSARLQTLTFREEEVLQRLHEGLAVRVIAEQSEVTEATVRSQVKAILKKLDVNSQMAAVAVYEDVLTDSTMYAAACR
jgi:DNA-binding NarL/FixJ family response regulator